MILRPFSNFNFDPRFCAIMILLFFQLKKTHNMQRRPEDKNLENACSATIAACAY